mmetsp:Transcript_62235/g.136263  ORF Transcript_62235/g.136263 Transcript_62235/m.136263 type:complete len:253 (+) Transcript_62235:279-1037(+)
MVSVGPCTDQATKMGSSLASLWVDVAAGILPGSLFAPDACHVVQVLHRHHASHQYLGVESGHRGCHGLGSYRGFESTRTCGHFGWLNHPGWSLFGHTNSNCRQHYLGLHLVLGGNLAVLHHCNHHIQMSQGGLLTYDAVGLGRCDESFGSGTASCNHGNCGCHGHIVACLPRCECHGLHVRDQYDVELWLAFFFIIDWSCTSSYGSVSLNASLLGFGFSNAAFFGFACRGDWKPHGDFRLCVELSQYKKQRR